MPENSKKVYPFGIWPSPLTAALVSQRTRLNDVQFSGDGRSLVWLEGRGSGSALVTWSDGDALRDLTGEQSPRGGVGYGGGEFTTSRSSDLLVFANRDGRLFRRGLGFERPSPITPTISAPNGAAASPTISPDGKWVVYVYSDGSTDLLALADSSGREWPVKLVSGADFYMQPAWHPSGTQLAWIEWDHPNMPWDGARVMLGQLEGTPPRIGEIRTVGGGSEVPVQQPLFSPDGRWLTFVEEQGEWPDLVLIDLQTQTRTVLIHCDGFDISVPNWSQGVHTMAWSADSRKVFYLRYDGPIVSLWSVDIDGGQSTQLDTQPYTWLSQLAASPTTEGLAFIASSANRPDEVVLWQPEGLRIVARSTPATYDPAILPPVREITWTAQGETVYGLYYPPANPCCTGEGQPPAIVHIHGGPTSLVFNRFNAEAAYFTSRGYAYVEVNYRGSTGYGRAYRHAMRQRWGDVDVEDAAACARALGEQNLADPKRLVITGGSAGGYTVLNALIRYPGLYKAGVCLYGVTQLFPIDLSTHKFEQQYNISMVGMLPEASERYRAWMPVYHAGNIRDALYIFQGDQDPVVPPSQAEAIVSALRAQGIPHKYKLYQGEGHGFRKPETIADYLKETEQFLQEYVLFAP